MFERLEAMESEVTAIVNFAREWPELISESAHKELEALQAKIVARVMQFSAPAYRSGV